MNTRKSTPQDLIINAYHSLKETKLELGGGNCGVVAIAILTWLASKGVKADIAYATDVENEDELIDGEPNLYHVVISYRGRYYDEMGKINRSYIERLVKNQYDTQTNILVYDFLEAKEEHEKIIRRNTAPTLSIDWLIQKLQEVS